MEENLHPRSEEKYDLAGRIESVKLTKTLYNHCAVGFLSDGDSVVVANGFASYSRNCLVKFDYASRTTRGNFITSDIPENFSGLDPEAYIFLAHWQKWMIKWGKYPEHKEINRYFDPGHFCWVVYSNLREKVVIKKNSILNISHLEYPPIIRGNLPNPREASRLIISESETELDLISKEIVKQGFLPIELDNFKINSQWGFFD